MPEGPAELMMPVSEEHALRQFEIEALRGINDVLKDLRSDAKEDRKLLHDMHARVIRIESNKLEPTVDELVRDVASLKRDKDRRDGVVSAWEWLLKSWPTIIGFIAVVVLILKLTGRI